MSFKSMSYMSSYSNINGVEDHKEKKMYDDGKKLKVYKRHNNKEQEKYFLGKDRDDYYDRKRSLFQQNLIENEIPSNQEQLSENIVPRRVFEYGFFNPEQIIQENIKMMNTMHKEMLNSFGTNSFFK